MFLLVREDQGDAGIETLIAVDKIVSIETKTDKAGHSLTVTVKIKCVENEQYIFTGATAMAAVESMTDLGIMP